LKASDTVSEAETGTPRKPQAHSGSPQWLSDRVLWAIYGLALAISILTWFIAIRSPLWLDETISFFQINGRFSEIMARQGWPAVPVYSYFLWPWAKVMGTSEVALRIPSVLAMLGAVYLLYLAARQLFDRDVALIAAVVFCLHPVILSASIDVRPYAFGALAITASILALFHLRHNDSNWLAFLFGLLAASIAYFQFLFVVMLPALALCFVVLKIGNRKTLWRQLAVALVAFAIAFVPVIPGMEYMFHTSGTHVFSEAPRLAELGQTMASKRTLLILAAVLLLAAATRRLDLKNIAGQRIFLCGALALIPILILYGVSAGTSVHVFVFRYRLVAAPGVALCWACIVSQIRSRALRLLFCVAVVLVTAYHDYRAPYSKVHGSYTWKYALGFVEKNASPDDAPVLICSDLPESDYVPMPVGAAAKDSAIFAPLTYYKLSVPVVALPRSLNDEAMRVGSEFLQDGTQRQERFLALAFEPSYKTLEWIADNASRTYDVHQLGIFDGIKVLEFLPRGRADASR
jgi:mannosyltransferase